MVKVNGKDMIFGTWFTIQNEGSAVVDLPMLPGHTLRCEIKPWPGENPWPKDIMEETERKNWEQDVSVKWVGQELHVLMPYLLQYKTDVREISFNIKPGGTVECQVIRQQVSGAMIVHIAMYLNTTVT